MYQVRQYDNHRTIQPNNCVCHGGEHITPVRVVQLYFFILSFRATSKSLYEKLLIIHSINSNRVLFSEPFAPTIQLTCYLHGNRKSIIPKTRTVHLIQGFSSPSCSLSIHFHMFCSDGSMVLAERILCPSCNFFITELLPAFNFIPIILINSNKYLVTSSTL